jgi:hypothetical protein
MAWAPSLYMGLVPLVLALSSVRFIRGRARERWLTWIGVAALLAGLGWYGVGWLWSEMELLAGGDGRVPVGSPFGGLYWLMTVLLPGHVYFRYPAKLLVIAALAISMLAASGWDRVIEGDSRRERRALLCLVAISAIGALISLVLRPFWAGLLAGVPADPLFGPFDAGAAGDLLRAFLHSIMIGSAAWGLLWLTSPGARQYGVNSRIAWPAMAILLLTAIDLGAANGWMVVCASESDFQRDSSIAKAIESDRAVQPDADPYRVFRRPALLPHSWQEHSSAERISEIVRWERASLAPRHHLNERIALAEVYGTMMPQEYRALLATRGPGWHSAVNAAYTILPADRRLEGGRAVEFTNRGESGMNDISLWFNPNHLPRAWVAKASSGEKCRITRYEPSRVDIEAHLTQPGFVVLADQFYPGWRVDVESDGGRPRREPIRRVNRVMRGVWLPSGEHRLVFRYRPASVLWGAAVSGLGWIALAYAARSRSREPSETV